jgi:hypothetical protein
MGMQRGLINREHPISAPSRFESDTDNQWPCHLVTEDASFSSWSRGFESRRGYQVSKALSSMDRMLDFQSGEQSLSLCRAAKFQWAVGANWEHTRPAPESYEFESRTVHQV